MIKTHRISKAQQEVWEWRDACYREVAHLPRKEAMRKLLQNATEAARALNLKLRPLNSTRSTVVAEGRVEYGKVKRRK